MPEWAVQWLLGGLVSIILWFVVRTLRQVDRSQAELFTRLNTVEKDFYRFQGECTVRHNRRTGDQG